jgi:DNA-binding HxlR family transcriptional regulator
MSLIVGKCKKVVLCYLKWKTKRLGEFRKQIPDITEKMLSIQLKALGEDGLIKRCFSVGFVSG